MANFNLTESAVANANNSGGSNSSSKRRLCTYCQRTFHRNSLIRHQKICANKSSDARQQLRGRKGSVERRDSCFKENEVHSDDCRFGQDGSPPKLQIYSDGSNASGECEFVSGNVCNGPPTLQSVGEETPEVEVRVTRMRLNSVMTTNGYHDGTKGGLEGGSQLNGRLSKIRASEDITKFFSPQPSMTGIAAKIISTSNIADSSNRGSLNVKSELGKTKVPFLKTSSVSKRPLPGGKSTSQCKKQKQDLPSATQTSASTAKTVVVLSDPAATEFKCQKCLLNFESAESLHSHGISYIQNGTLVCLLCSNKQVDNLDIHFKEDHQTEKKKVFCELCSTTVDRNYHFYHLKEHHSLVKKFKCNLCSKEFSFMQNLLLHKSNDHLKEMYNSKYCQRNGDMMNVRDVGGGCGSICNSNSSSNGNVDKEKITKEGTSSLKSRYVRRYGAPPRKSSSETKGSGNYELNENLTYKLSGASLASLITVSENGLNGNLSGICRRSSTESSDSEVNQLNSSGSITNVPEVSHGSSVDSSSDTLPNKSSDSSPENAKNSKTVNTIYKTGDNTTATALSAVSSSQPPSPSLKPDPAFSTETQLDVCKEYTCRLCSVKFESRFKYLRHLRDEHHWTRDQLLDPEYEPEFWCPECGQEFVVRPTLMKHVIIAHEDVTDLDDYMERVGYGSRPLIQFQCSVCLNVFESERDLSFHLRCHGLAYLQYLTSNSRLC